MVDVGFIFTKSVFLSEFHNLLIVLLPIQAFVQKSIFYPDYLDVYGLRKIEYI